MIENVEQMPVYRAFFELATDVEKATRTLGSDFKWLRSQALRSSESVCANMSEGFYAQYSTEYLQSLYRCRREGRETMTHLHYSSTVGQLPEPTVVSFIQRYEAALRQLANLIASIERKILERGKAKPPGQSGREASERIRDNGPWVRENEPTSVP